MSAMVAASLLSITTASAQTTYGTVFLPCDANDKTPSEEIDCKLDYWRQKIDSLQSDKATIEKAIAQARERLSAFKNARQQR